MPPFGPRHWGTVYDVSRHGTPRVFLPQASSKPTSREIGIVLNWTELADSRWHGQFNVAFSRARYAGKDGLLRLASFDYPVVANATGAWRLTDRWTLSTRVVFLSGRPYTPFDEDASAAARRGIYDTGRVNDERLGAYFRLDVRVDRTFSIGGRPVRVFAGAQNVTNRENAAASRGIGVRIFRGRRSSRGSSRSWAWTGSSDHQAIRTGV